MRAHNPMSRTQARTPQGSLTPVQGCRIEVSQPRSLSSPSTGAFFFQPPAPPDFGAPYARSGGYPVRPSNCWYGERASGASHGRIALRRVLASFFWFETFTSRSQSGCRGEETKTARSGEGAVDVDAVPKRAILTGDKIMSRFGSRGKPVRLVRIWPGPFGKRGSSWVKTLNPEARPRD